MGPLLALYKIVKGGFANPCPDTDIYFPICHSYDHDTISLWLITNLFDYFFDWMFCSNYLHSYKQYIFFFYALGCLENTSLEVWGESQGQQMCGWKGGWPCKYSCKNISMTLIQISRLFNFVFFSKTNNQMIIWLTPKSNSF